MPRAPDYTAPRRQSLAQWQRWENVGLAPEEDLGSLILNWTADSAADLEARGAITGVQLDRTIEGASTLTITLRDPRAQVLDQRAGHLVDPTRARARKAAKQTPTEVDEGWNPIHAPGVIGRAMEVDVDGVVFRLVQVRYSSARQEVTLTFEDRIVYWLRRKRGAKRADRARLTRAQFILSLLQEVKSRQYRFVCPELHVTQPVDKPSKATGGASVTAPAKARETSGVPPALDRIYPRHRIGAAGAARLSERQVRAVAELAGLSPTDALHAAQIAHGESDYYPGVVQDDPGDGMVGHGLWQMTPNAWGGTTSATYRHMESLGGLEAMRNPMQAARQMKWMHDQAKGWGPWYGTRYLNLSATASKSILGEGVEADVTGSAEGSASSGGGWETKRYQFARNSDEDSWTAMQRLAQEVGWRLFVVGNSVYYMSEEQLYGRRPRYDVQPDDPAVLDLSYDLDWGKPVSEATLTVALDRWGAPPGAVVTLTGWGPPDGRWVISQVSRDWFAPTAAVTIKQPGKALLEPANERSQRASSAPSDSSGADVDADGSKGSQVYAAAKAISDKNLPYTWGGGHSRCGTPDGGTGRDPGPGYDCSGSVCAALAAAGLGYKIGGPADGSGAMAANWGEPGQGRQFTVWANGGHVWIQFHDMGAWRFDTSPYGSGPRGPHLRSTPRPTAGFTARHWPGV